MTREEALLTQTPQEALLEAVAKEIYAALNDPVIREKGQPLIIQVQAATNAAMRALNRSLPGLSSLVDGTGVVVPVEPTKLMYAAAYDALVPAGDAEAAYRAMLAAAEQERKP